MKFKLRVVSDGASVHVLQMRYAGFFRIFHWGWGEIRRYQSLEAAHEAMERIKRTDPEIVP